MGKEQTNLGDLISLFYEEFYGMYGDAELASVAAAAVINDMLAAQASRTPTTCAEEDWGLAA
jgi:hypothetical protein